MNKLNPQVYTDYINIDSIYTLVLYYIYIFLLFQTCNSDSYEVVSSLIMKQIYDAVKIIQNQGPIRSIPDIDEDYGDNDFYGDEDGSEDEGTSVPINAKCLTNSSSQPEVPRSELCSGYTNENAMIDVINHLYAM